jgi:hypothetical protein
MVKSQGITSKAAAPVDEMVRNFSVNGKKPFSDWIGITDSGALGQLQRGEGLVGLPSDLRKVVLDKWTSVKGQKLLGFNEEDFRLALTDPRLSNAQKHDLGLLWYEMDLNKPPELSKFGSGHKTYNYDSFGSYIGNAPMVKTSDAYGDVYNNIYDRVLSKTGKPLHESTKAQNTIHSLRDLHNDSSLFLDKAAIDRLKKLFNR